MPPRISTALSKAAAEHRRKNQIPRKKPTNGLHSHRQIAKVHKTSSRSNKKKRACSNAYLQPSRGENRKKPPGNNGNSWPVRRILASRQKPSDPSVLEYKVQWDTSWEEASTIKGPAIGEWDEAQKTNGTFSYWTKEGTKWTVLRDETREENDHEEMQWDMWVAIHRNVLQEIKKDWFEDLADDDFEFALDNGGTTPGRLARRHSERESLSALETLRAAWHHFTKYPDHEVLDGDLKIRYVGQLDPRYDEASSDANHRPAVPVGIIVRTLYSHHLSRLDVSAFSRSQNAYAASIHWREVLHTLISNAPFIFRTGTWMQLLALLLLSGDTFRAQLREAGVEVDEEWPSRAREYAMHMYYETVLDDRAPHDIQETFLSLREFFRDLTPEEDDVKPTELDSPSGSVYGTDGCRMPPLGNAFFCPQTAAPHARPFDREYDAASQEISSDYDRSSFMLPRQSITLDASTSVSTERLSPQTKDSSSSGRTVMHPTSSATMQQDNVQELFKRFMEFYQQGPAQRDPTLQHQPATESAARRMSATVSNRKGSIRVPLPSIAECLSHRPEEEL